MSGRTCSIALAEKHVVQVAQVTVCCPGGLVECKFSGLNFVKEFRRFLGKSRPKVAQNCLNKVQNSGRSAQSLRKSVEIGSKLTKTWLRLTKTRGSSFHSQGAVI